MHLEAANGKRCMSPLNTAGPAHPPPCTSLQPTAKTLCYWGKYTILNLNLRVAHGYNLEKKKK